MEEKRKKDFLREEASKFGASDAPLTVDAHQYVALAHGPDVEEAVGEEEESNSSSCWIRRSFVSEDHHEESSVATELPYSSSHLWKFGKNAGRLKLFALLVLCLLAALALVGLRSSVVVWEKEAEEEAPGIFSVARNETASRAATTGGVVVPYPTRRTAFHVRPPKNWISGECKNVLLCFVWCPPDSHACKSSMRIAADVLLILCFVVVCVLWCAFDVLGAHHQILVVRMDLDPIFSRRTLQQKP
jgi:hypothetical protein